jgi:hypothetical protein
MEDTMILQRSLFFFFLVVLGFTLRASRVLGSFLPLESLPAQKEENS